MIVILLVTGLIAWLSQVPAETARSVIVFFACWILLDMFVYHVNVLWFDDLEPQWEPRVWSFRRILVQAFINFLEMIVLFAVLYRLLADIRCDFKSALFYSFATAFSLNLPEDFLDMATNSQISYILWSSQILLSDFF